MSLIRPVLFRETADQRRAILDAIRINDQSLDEVDWLQTDRIVRITVPDDFRGILYPDSHSPWEDSGILRAVWQFAELWQPHLAFDIGDFTDQGWLSRWPQNAKGGSAFTHRGEMDSARRQLRRKMEAGNPKKLIVIPGNHDDRERQQLSGDAGKFGRLLHGRNREFLTDMVKNVLGFTEADPLLVAWGLGQTGGREGGVMVGDMRMRHGNFVDRKPGYSAYKHVLAQLVSVIMGHVHRAGDFAVEARSGNVVRGIEAGHNIDSDSPGMNYVATDHNWIRAFVVLRAVNGVLNAQVVPFLLGEDCDTGRRCEYATWLDLNHNIIEFAAQDS